IGSAEGGDGPGVLLLGPLDRLAALGEGGPGDPLLGHRPDDVGHEAVDAAHVRGEVGERPLRVLWDRPARVPPDRVEHPAALGLDGSREVSVAHVAPSRSFSTGIELGHDGGYSLFSTNEIWPSVSSTA